MKIGIAGYRGFIGKAVIKQFGDAEFILIDRQEVYRMDDTLISRLEGVDMIMNFAGSPVLKRWNRKNRRNIETSRVTFTKCLIELVNALNNKPEMFINTSAIGLYEYGTLHDELHFTEGNGYLPKLVRDWEGALEYMDHSVDRIVVRLGLVCGNSGGALPTLKRMTKIGLGAVIGSGKQVYSFIHIEDVCRAIRYIVKERKKGIFNLTAPEPVTNKKFVRELGKSMNRPVLFRIPAFIFRMLYGEAADILIKGHTVIPRRLLNEGFNFTFKNIEKVFRDLMSEKQ